jgi:regulator of cell morphogenesis and NO signaling
MIRTERSPEMECLTLAEVALEFPQAIKILNRYGLDYCFNGRKLFIHACERAGVSAEKVWSEITNELPMTGPTARYKFQNWKADMLMDFIQQHHHEYLRRTIPEISGLLNVVCSVHGNDKPELQEIQSHFETLAIEILEHMPTEENVLFPAIRRIAKSPVLAENQNLLESVQINIAALEHEHSRAGDLLKIIRELSDNYQSPVYACPTFQMAFRLLEEFEQDLMQHIHLENNVLFTKVRSERESLANH